LTQTIRILLVDDHPVVREGLRGMLTGESGFEVVAEAADGHEAVSRAVTFEPDVILMDLRMPGGDGVAAIRELVDRGVASRVLVLTTFDTDRDVIAAIDAGATGYLLKDTPRDELFRAVRAAARGETSLSPTVATQLIGRVRDPGPDALSPRELEVLQAVARGATNREVAAKLHISETTVKTHLLHIYGKFGVNDRAAAVAVAYERGVLQPGSSGG
jgi:DNA-binding NarL/FixJ family response regulator